MSTLNIDTTEFASAFRTVRFAKNIFMILILFCLLTQLAGAVLVEFFQCHQATEIRQPVQKSPETKPAEEPTGPEGQATTAPATMPAAETQPKTAPATQPAETADEEPAESKDEVRYDKWKIDATRILQYALPTTKFVGFVSSILLLVTMLMASLLSLLGRSGGVAGLYSAFFWTLILVAGLTPWQQILQTHVASGMTFNLGRLLQDYQAVNSEMASFVTRVIYYARYFAYPLLGLLVWIIVQIKFASAAKKILNSPLKPMV